MFDLRLARANGLDDHQVKASGVQHLDRIGCGPGQAAEVAPTGHAADKDAPIPGQVPHADAVAQDGPSGEGAGGVYGQDANGPGQVLAVAPAEMERQGVDQRALAAAGRAGHANDVRLARVGMEGGQQSLGFGAIVLDEADAAGDGPPLASEHSLDEVTDGGMGRWLTKRSHGYSPRWCWWVYRGQRCRPRPAPAAPAHLRQG